MPDFKKYNPKRKLRRLTLFIIRLELIRARGLLLELPSNTKPGGGIWRDIFFCLSSMIGEVPCASRNPRPLTLVVSVIIEALVETKNGNQSILTSFIRIITTSKSTAPVAEGNLTPMLLL